MRPLAVKRPLIRLVVFPLQRFVRGVIGLWGEGRLHRSSRLMEMCCWMGSHFCDWVDCQEVVFNNRVTRMGSHILWILGVRKFI